MRGRRVGLVFGGRSVEHAVSLTSARTVFRGLDEAGHEVVPLAIGTDGSWWSVDASRAALLGGVKRLDGSGESAVLSLRHLVAAEVEVLFPLVHGTWGEDGTLPGLCEILDLPYAGSDVTTSAVAMDKELCKRLLRASALPVVDDRVVRRRDLSTLGSLDLGFPLFVKPSVGGSSVGVTKVGRREELLAAVEEALRFDEKILIERAVDGAREIESAVLGGEEIEVARALGEIVPGREFYDYADKYLDDSARLLAPATLPDELTGRVHQLARRAFEAIGGVGMARVDFLLSEAGDLFVNELNTVPGFTSISMYPRLWALSGLPLPELVDRLVEEGLDRHRRRHELDRGIKEWIGSLAP